MLSLIRQARSGSTVAGAILRLASDSLVAAEGAAALPSLQHSASRASVTQLLTNLRLFDPRPPAHAGFFSLSPVAAGHQPPPQAHASGQHCGSRTSGLSSSLHSSSSSSSTGSAAGCSPASTHRGLATSAARLQDGAPAGGAATPAATPPEGVNPLQALPGVGGGNPLSGAVPAAGGPARDPIARAILRNTKISPQKLNDFARIVRRLHVDEAIVQCQISIKKAAKLVQNLLESAKANGVNNHGLDGGRLYVEQIIVTQAKMLKRTAIHGRGRSGVLHKRRSHMTVILRELQAAARAPRRVTRIHAPMLQRGRDQ